MRPFLASTLLVLMCTVAGCGERSLGASAGGSSVDAVDPVSPAMLADARRAACIAGLRQASPVPWPLERQWYPVSAAIWYANGPAETDAATKSWIGNWTSVSAALGDAFATNSGKRAEAAFRRLLLLRASGRYLSPAQLALADTDLLGAAVALRQRTGTSLGIVQAVAASEPARATFKGLTADGAAAPGDSTSLLGLKGPAEALAIYGLLVRDRHAAEQAYATARAGRHAFVGGTALPLFGRDERTPAVGCSSAFLDALERFAFDFDAYLLAGFGDAALLDARAARLKARSVGDAASAVPILATYRTFLARPRSKPGDSSVIAFLATARRNGGIQHYRSWQR